MSINEALVTITPGEDGAAGYPLPEPTEYSGATSTMVDAGISVSGKLLGSMVRSDVAQISLSWNYLSVDDWSAINRIFKDRYINTVRFFDQTKGGWDEREMYISDRAAGLWRRDSEGEVVGWTGCSLQLTEV